MPGERPFNSLLFAGDEVKSDNDLWFAYAHRNGRRGPNKIAVVRKSVYDKLSASDYISVASGEITTDPKTYKKNKQQIRPRLYYEIDSSSPAVFTEHEAKRPYGPIEKRGKKFYRARTKTLLCTYDAKRIVNSILKDKQNNREDLSSSQETCIDIDSNNNGTNIEEITPNNLYKGLNNHINAQTISSDDLWLAYSYRESKERGSTKLAFIKNSAFLSLSTDDRVSVYNGEITTDTIILTKNKKHISNRLYYEVNSDNPVLFTEDEIKKPGGPIERRGYTYYRAGTSTILQTYHARSRIRCRIRDYLEQINGNPISSTTNEFKMSQDINTTIVETQHNPIDHEVITIPESILQQMFIENSLYFQGSLSFFNTEEEQDQIEMKNSSNEDEKHCTNDINDDLNCTETVTNFDEAFSDSYWEQFRTRDEETDNLMVASEYQNSFIFFQPAITGLGKRHSELQETPNSKRHKTNN